MKYWFKPFKIGYVALYYPVSWQGYIISALALFIVVHDFIKVDQMSHSVSDTLLGASIPIIGILIIFNIITRLKGEYPWWWKKRRSNKK